MILDLNYSSLDKEIVKPNKVKFLTELTRESVTEIQSVLKSTNYYKGSVDGIPGKLTQDALTNFKKDCYLERFTEIGISTVKALKILKNRHPVSEQVQVSDKITINKKINTYSGKTAILPNGQRVFANQLIVEGVPLTWGELTKDLTRIPHDTQVVKNCVKIASFFGELRAAIAVPLKINSGYRPPQLNIGAKNSQHKLGLAIDVCPIDGNLNKLWHYAVQSRAIGLGRGLKYGFVHLDLRETGEKRVVFNY